jgi:cytochrome P450
VYVINSPEAIQELLAGNVEAIDKGPMFDKARPYLGNGVVTSNGADHVRHRKLARPAFHRDAIAGYFPEMARCAATHAGAWRPGQTILVDREMNRLATTATTTAMFGPQTGRRIAPLVADAERAFSHGVIKRTLTPLPARVLNKIPSPAAARLRSAVQQLIAVPEPETMLSHLAAIADQRVPGTEVRDQVITLLLAGIETTSATMTWLFYELARNPAIDRRVSAEARQAVAAGQTAGLDRLDYTRRVLTETLRLHSPAWLITRRSTMPVTIGQVAIPPGSDLAYSPVTLHRDRRLYDEPLRFDPDRWLLPHVRDGRQVFLPFSAGNHHCFGDSFAWTEMLLTTAAVMSRWRLALPQGATVRPVARAVLHAGRLPMTVLERDAAGT